MSILDNFIAQLKADNERTRETLEDYRSGKAEIGSVDVAGEMTSYRDERVRHLEQTIEANEAMIARYEAGER